MKFPSRPLTQAHNPESDFERADAERTDTRIAHEALELRTQQFIIVDQQHFQR
jgi:hypothetical protein